MPIVLFTGDVFAHPILLPLDAMLLETDAPFLAPAPHRGQPNEPAFLVETAKKLAPIKSASLEMVAEATTRNFERLFLKRTPEQS